MRTRHCLAFSLAVLVGAFALLDAGHSDGDAFAWRTDLAAAIEEAKTAGKPLMLVFR